MPIIVILVGQTAILKEEYIENERELLEAVALGNEQSFSDLYTLYYKRLYAFLMKMNGNQEGVVRDILQESFLRVWLNRDRLVEVKNFQAWVYKVVSTENLTYLRRELHAKVKIDRFKEYLGDDWETSKLPAHLEIKEIKSLIQSIVQRMPERRREIYLLSREHGLNTSEIAVMLNISENTVHNTITTALRQIREGLKSAGYQVLLSILFFLHFF